MTRLAREGRRWSGLLVQALGRRFNSLGRYGFLAEAKRRNGLATDGVQSNGDRDGSGDEPAAENPSQ
uniref:Uncharacterized protein n=1 Tax=Chromera velia CCMP2878 TaxID=1169474 RepID=A0A0G4HAJ3_9ALVE|eukprot:Cvel_25676.t1-p1 / transcript=Cvel_25676.t1 / gene=Cvel_25676 / organism=Chromera_velia_CCMP2878 / gene_product=hypothetical protein / transcript_product=hypothetical protein / location=Cvel_scaffold2942:19602-22245(+) / protein_length=66 / sequence_SO=supercontig / SO=protein_coding / is_pseudo=false